jgi:capsular polysaccharide biosynthesis protein
VLLNTVVALMLGLLLGIGAALLLELTRRRVRSTEDLVEALHIPMLGSITSSHARLAFNQRGALE